MSYTISVNYPNTNNVIIDYLGEFEVGKEYTITDEQADLFYIRHGMSITDAFSSSSGVSVRVKNSNNKTNASTSSGVTGGTDNG